ncbi:hypothetical protein LTR62_001424 [Meristemomyces frigidus]|uniref:Asl1-like glycosyl hydrolase catalytic domain-containing protein n=1 Tax=Meristemomyces frigidus TaxID=1508187 RepID=A0AAN7T915_9PEZI|nr:hypothetical protein LTR62_001424 [Meristemomyces frigidus]
MSALLALTLLAAASSASAQSASVKRGLCYVATQDSEKDDNIWTGSNSDLTWYYNYQASPTSGLAAQLEFVPMLWGAPSSNTDMTFYNTVESQIKSGSKINYVLGFNEPDGCSNGGSCVDAQTAAQTWIREIEPLKTKYKVSLGAPAVTGAPAGFTWLQNFFTACDGGCTPDFIPIHWFGNFEGLASHVGQVNATYENMTMWVTEYGYPEMSLSATEDFFNQSTSFFDRIDYITNYSYFGAFRSSVSNIGPNAAMLSKKGKLTKIGAWYLGQKDGAKNGAAQLGSFSGWAVVVVGALFWLL